MIGFCDLKKFNSIHLHIFVFVYLISVSQTLIVLDEGSSFNLLCSIDGRKESDSTGWFYSLKRVRPRTPLVTNDLIQLSPDGTTLTFTNASAQNVGTYECLDAATGTALLSEDVFVHSNGSLLVPLSSGERIIRVFAGSPALIPCRLADPTNENIKIELTDQSGDVIDLNDAGIEYDEQVGFVILKGNLRHHSGIVTCRAYSEEPGTQEDIQEFPLHFSLHDVGNLPGIPEIVEANQTDHVDVLCPDDSCTGLSFSLQCKLPIKATISPERLKLKWKLPETSTGKFNQNFSIQTTIGGKKFLLNILTVSSWTFFRGTIFSCVATSETVDGNQLLESKEVSIRKKLKPGSNDKIRWDLSPFNSEIVVHEKRQSVRWVVGLHHSARDVSISWIDQKGKEISGLRQKYSLVVEVNKNVDQQKIICVIFDVSYDDMGDYKLVVTRRNGVSDSLDMRLRILTDRPKVNFGNFLVKNFYPANRSSDFSCQVSSYPMNTTRIEVGFINCTTTEECSSEQQTLITVLNGEIQFSGQEHSVVKYQPLQEISTYSVNLQFSITAGHSSGILTCMACLTGKKCAKGKKQFFITDIAPGVSEQIVGPQGGKSTVDDKISIKCGVSQLKYSSIIWYRKSESEHNSDQETWHMLGLGYKEETMKLTETSSIHSFWSEVQISRVAHHHAGSFACRPKPWHLMDANKTSEEISLEYELKVVDIVAASIDESRSNLNNDKTIFRPGENFTFRCFSNGNPAPTIRWTKDGHQIDFKSQIFVPKLTSTQQQQKEKPDQELYIYSYQISRDNSSLHLMHSGLVQLPNKYLEASPSLEGNYSCYTENRGGNATGFTYLTGQVNLTSNSSVSWITAPIIIIFVLILCVGYAYHRFKLRKTKEQMTKFIKGFNLGDPKALESLFKPNSENLMDREKANLLPYDPKWEIPIESITFGPELGSGAFGRVLRGEVEVDAKPGAGDDEEVGLLLAQRLSRSQSFNFGIRTKKSKKVITVAVKTLKPDADTCDFKSLASELKIMGLIGQHENLVNLLGACTKNLKDRKLFMIVEYCPHGNLLDVIKKFGQHFISVSLEDLRRVSGSENELKNLLENASKTRSLPISQHSPSPSSQDNGYITVGEAVTCFTFSNIENPTRLSTAHLISWAKQVSDGMSHLGSKKILHGDLACRNVLLSTENTVKICDFGLAKVTQKVDGIYQKSVGEKLPVAWMAPESMTQLVFTTKSDVWSYGVFMWEVFSLGLLPYANYPLGQELVDAIVYEGVRLSEPAFAPSAIYRHIMMECWHHEPQSRLSFEEISAKLNALASVDRRHLPTLEKTFQATNLSTGYNAHYSVENSLYWMSESPKVSNEVDDKGYLVSLKSPMAQS